MFDAASRYANIATSIYVRPADGARIPYVQRRLVPPPDSIPISGRAAVHPQERLDQFAARTLGDPVRFWRIADANNALNPFDLCSPGRVLKIPLP